jgi:hypothetical protein
MSLLQQEWLLIKVCGKVYNFYVRYSNSAKSYLNFLKLNLIITKTSKKFYRSVYFLQNLEEFFKKEIIPVRG